MHYTQIGVLILTFVVAGCSSETTSPSAISEPAGTPSANDPDVTSARDAEPGSAATSPEYEAVIFIHAAKKEEDGPSCTSDMAADGKSECGPESSLTKLSWEFTEHRDGADYYKYHWNLTSNGEPEDSKGLTVGFDGDTEATVIDAEHYIAIRKGPLSPDTERAE